MELKFLIEQMRGCYPISVQKSLDRVVLEVSHGGSGVMDAKFWMFWLRAIMN